MALEAINEIKEAEKKAEMIISEAKQNAKEIVSGATKEADIKYDEIISEAKAKANNLLNAALEEGNSNAEPILKIGEKEIEAILNIFKHFFFKSKSIILFLQFTKNFIGF